MRVFFSICLLVLFLPPSARAQKPPPLRDVGALGLTDHTLPELFFQDASGEPRPFAIGQWSRGPVNRMPAGESLRLMRRVEDPATRETTLVTALELPMPRGENPLLLVCYQGENGKAVWRLIEDVPSHAAGTVRLLNLSGRETVCKLEDKTLELESSADRVVPVANPGAFTYVYGARQPDGTVFKCSPKRLRFPRPDMRLLILFASFPEEVDGHRRFVVRDARVYDRVAAPELVAQK